jgi:hypothetical protein
MTTAVTTAEPAAPSALRLTGELDPHLSRWLWLVKMFLAVPHFVALAVLWAGLILTTVAAWVAILVTGQYPRPLFDFAVGVLRWTWRVGFYVWAALGTDSYPPFTLSRTEHPAKLEVEYPQQLSRALVLVKWVLAVPHVIIALLLVTDLVASANGSGAFSVLNLVVVIAGVFLLITGQYPRSLFRFLMGINRWLYRLIVYIAFMRDEYPPFRLDEGSKEA